MGLGLSFVAGEGPKFEKPVQDEAAVKALYVPDPADKLKYVTDAVCEIKRALNNRIPLIGFPAAPLHSPATWLKAEALPITAK